MQGLQGRPTPPLYRRLRSCFMAGGRGSGQPTAGSFLMSPTIADGTSVESSPKSAKPVSPLANNVRSTITCRGFSITANMKSIPIIGTPSGGKGEGGRGEGDSTSSPYSVLIMGIKARYPASPLPPPPRGPSDCQGTYRSRTMVPVYRPSALHLRVFQISRSSRTSMAES